MGREVDASCLDNQPFEKDVQRDGRGGQSSERTYFYVHATCDDNHALCACFRGVDVSWGATSIRKRSTCLLD